MIEFAEPRVIRPVTDSDLEMLQKSLPKRDPDVHRHRYQLQKDGSAVYLLAVQGTNPVAHLLLNWNGTSEETVRTTLAKTVPDIDDLFVHPDHRNRKVASRLLESAEALARERGYDQLGVGCDVSDAETRAFYKSRGFLDSGISPYSLPVDLADAAGKEGDVIASKFAYLLLPLAKTSISSATEKNMDNNESTTAPVGPDEGTASDPNKTPERPLSDQVVDFAFGVALTAAEALEKAVQVLGEKAKVVQSEAPAVWESLQEKGRPAREKLVQSLREETREEAEAAAQPKAEPTVVVPEATNDTVVAGDVPSEEAKPVTSKPTEPSPIKPAPRPFGFGRMGNVSAEDEIKALEERVKSLEREVVISPMSLDTSSNTLLTEEAIDTSEQTPAEMGTALVDFTPATNSSDALTNSPYAITDDEERATTPTQTGVFVEDFVTVPPIIDTPSVIVEAPIEETAPVVTDTVADSTYPAAEAMTGETETTASSEPQLSPAKGKRSRKTSSEAASGVDVSDESDLANGTDLEA